MPDLGSTVAEVRQVDARRIAATLCHGRYSPGHDRTEVPVTLEALGVSAVHEQVYRQLVDIGPARAGELAAHLGLTVPDVGAALEALMAFGLALVDDADRSRFIAASPAVALGSLINERRNRLHQAEISVTEMIERYRTAAGGRAVRDLIEVVTGTEAVGHRCRTA